MNKNEVILKTFLRENGLFAAYMANLEEYCIANDIDPIAHYNDILDDVVYTCLDGAFDWSTSNEGFHFWNEIYDKFVNEIEEQ